MTTTEELKSFSEYINVNDIENKTVDEYISLRGDSEKVGNAFKYPPGWDRYNLTNVKIIRIILIGGGGAAGLTTNDNTEKDHFQGGSGASGQVLDIRNINLDLPTQPLPFIHVGLGGFAKVKDGETTFIMIGKKLYALGGINGVYNSANLTEKFLRISNGGTVWTKQLNQSIGDGTAKPTNNAGTNGGTITNYTTGDFDYNDVSNNTAPPDIDRNDDDWTNIGVNAFTNDRKYGYGRAGGKKGYRTDKHVGYNGYARIYLSANGEKKVQTPSFISTANFPSYPLTSGLIFDVYNTYIVNQENRIWKTHDYVATNFASISSAIPISLPPFSPFSIQWTGYFKADVSGQWRFNISSNDGSYVWVWLGEEAFDGYTKNNALIDNDGINNGAITKSWDAELTSDKYYYIRIQYGNSSGSSSFSFTFNGPSGSSASTPTGNGSEFLFTNYKTTIQNIVNILPSWYFVFPTRSTDIFSTDIVYYEDTSTSSQQKTLLNKITNATDTNAVTMVSDPGRIYSSYLYKFNGPLSYFYFNMYTAKINTTRMFWIYVTSSQADKDVFCSSNYKISFDTSQKIVVKLNGSTTATCDIPQPLNQWTHYAIVCTDTSCNIYMNGSLNQTVAGKLSNEDYSNVSLGKFTGYMHNMRLYNQTVDQTGIEKIKNDTDIQLKAIDFNLPSITSNVSPVIPTSINTIPIQYFPTSISSGKPMEKDPVIPNTSTYVYQFNSTYSLYLATAMKQTNVVMFWVYNTDTDMVAVSDIFCSDAYKISFNAEKKLTVTLNATSTTPSSIICTTVHPTNAWVHYAIVCNNGTEKTCSIYMFGELAGSETDVGLSKNETRGITIGGYGLLLQNFKGYLYGIQLINDPTISTISTTISNVISTTAIMLIPEMVNITYTDKKDMPLTFSKVSYLLTDKDKKTITKEMVKDPNNTDKFVYGFDSTYTIKLITAMKPLNSLLLWIYTSEYTGGKDVFCSNNYRVSFDQNENLMVTLNASSTKDTVISTITHPYKAWTHYAILCDVSKCSIYMNGILVASKANVKLTATDYSGICVGGHNQTPSFNGCLYGQLYNSVLDKSLVNINMSQTSIMPIPDNVQFPISSDSKPLPKVNEIEIRYFKK